MFQVDTFLENAQRIFDVARADAAYGMGDDCSDFTLLVRTDGSLHMIMEQTVNPESAAIAYGAETAYHVTRNRKGVTVSGRNGENQCKLTSGIAARRAPLQLLADQPLYVMACRELPAAAFSIPR